MKMTPFKVRIASDKYFNHKECFQDSEMIKHVPVDMHNRPVAQGKKDQNAQDKLDALNLQQGNSCGQDCECC